MHDRRDDRVRTGEDGLDRLGAVVAGPHLDRVGDETAVEAKGKASGDLLALTGGGEKDSGGAGRRGGRSGT